MSNKKKVITRQKADMLILDPSAALIGLGLLFLGSSMQVRREKKEGEGANGQDYVKSLPLRSKSGQGPGA